MKKAIPVLVIGSIVGSIVGLYTTFLIENLWNWFATSAFHVPEMSFWGMYGLVLLVGLFTTEVPRSVYDDPQWKGMLIILEACVPDDKREMVTDELKDQIENTMWTDVVVQSFSTSVGKLVGNTFVLVLGWAVHTFLI
jgi:hypothetical protein